MSARLDQLLEKLDGVVKSGEGYLARCPAHGDRRQSLSISQGEKGVVLHCHAGCTTEAVCTELGLSVADLFGTNGNGKREIVATYDYTDEDGHLLFQVVRFSPKGFAQRRPVNGSWEWKLGDVRRVLYRLPRVIETASAGGTIYVVEGEKDVEALERAGAVATCNPGGAGKWRPEYSECLRGAEVTIVADDDAPGREHASAVRASLAAFAGAVRVVAPAQGNDTSDHFRAGNGLQDFRPLDESDRPRVYSGLDLAAMEVSTPRPVCDGFLYEGCSTLLIGQPKLAGKTTLSLDVARCIVAGEPWCGRETMRSPVLYLSEQSPPSFNPQVERAALNVADFYVMYYSDFIGTDWPDIAAFATQIATERGCRVVMIDNYALWVGFTGEQENQSGPAMEAMRPVEKMKAAGITVAILTHSRKEGGSIAELARGSGATIGLYDVLASLKGDSVPRRRVLDVTGRPFAETPEPFVVTFTDNHRYKALGSRATVSAHDLRDTVLLCLFAESEAKTEEEIVEACKGSGFGHNKVRDALRKMSDEGLINRQRGVVPGYRGYGYWRGGRDATLC